MIQEAKELANEIVFDLGKWYFREDIKPTSLTNYETEVYKKLVEFEKIIIEKYKNEIINY